MGERLHTNADNEAFIRRTVARLRVDERFRARAKLAETAPKATLLPEGSNELVTDLIRHYTAPVVFVGGHYTGVRLHFARMSDEDAWWKAMGQVLLRRCGDMYVLQPIEDMSVAPLRLSFDGAVIKRLRDKTSHVAVPRIASMRGIRLA